LLVGEFRDPFEQQQIDAGGSAVTAFRSSIAATARIRGVRRGGDVCQPLDLRSPQ
jgi:hypothetical protein